MACGFSCIVDVDLNIYWSRTDNMHSTDMSHIYIIANANIVENNSVYLRRWIRIEFPKWKTGKGLDYDIKNGLFCFDEQSSLPTWVEENKEEIYQKTLDLMERVKPIVMKYFRMTEDTSDLKMLESQRENEFLKIKGYIPYLSNNNDELF